VYSNRKRTTAPDELSGPMGSPSPRTQRRSVVASVTSVCGLPPRATACAVIELAHHRRRLRHRPTLAQLWMMIHFDGREPCSYELDPAVNFVPDVVPVGFPSGRNGLCFVRGSGGELVVAPDGTGFSLT
jgi:hypothetical protein